MYIQQIKTYLGLSRNVQKWGSMPFYGTSVQWRKWRFQRCDGHFQIIKGINSSAGKNRWNHVSGIRIRNIDWATQFFGESPVQTCWDSNSMESIWYLSILSYNWIYTGINIRTIYIYIFTYTYIQQYYNHPKIGYQSTGSSLSPLGMDWRLRCWCSIPLQRWAMSGSTVIQGAMEKAREIYQIAKVSFDRTILEADTIY